MTPNFNPAEYEAKQWSQFGEDGALLELVRRIKPMCSFVEIGSGNGSENCTRVLAENGWTGLWIDADPGNCIAARGIADPLGVRVLCQMVTRESVPTFAHLTAREFGVLSIDIDGNDYHLWQELCGGPYGWRPSVVIIESQIQKPFDEPYIMPYNASYVWDHRSFDCGASVKSMIDLGAELGFAYVGKLSEKHSPNLFFVRSDLVGKLE